MILVTTMDKYILLLSFYSYEAFDDLFSYISSVFRGSKILNFRNFTIDAFFLEFLC